MSGVGPTKNIVVDAVTAVADCLGVGETLEKSFKIEHAHIYSDSAKSGGEEKEKEKEKEKDGEEEIIGLHTDKGYLIGMTSSSAASGYYLQVDGELVQREGDVVIMAGEEGWQVEGWRAVPHRLVREAGKGGIWERSWYGIMFFVQKPDIEGAPAVNGIGADGSQCEENEVRQRV